MNVRDSEILRGLLEEAGYAFTDEPENADVIIFNTCSVREHAEHRAISILAALARKKGNRGRRITGLIGCVAQHKKEEIFKSIPKLDFICGPADLYSVPDIIARVRNGQKHIVNVRNERTARSVEYVNPGHRGSKIHAFVNIMYGCDNFCSYCIVPYVRGKEVSRSSKDIIKEVKDLAKRGIRHVTLLGQNVNSYNDRDCDFVKLLDLINNIGSIDKISFLTSHPKDASIRLFKAMRDLVKVDKHLHLPLQSGSDRILLLMNRGYTAKGYRGLIKKYRELVPGGRITTDIIVGYPSETEKDFRDTLELMKDIRFDGAYIFKYSPRPPARSSELKDDVPIRVKKERNNILLNTQKEFYKEKAGA